MPNIKLFEHQIEAMKIKTKLPIIWICDGTR